MFCGCRLWRRAKRPKLKVYLFADTIENNIKFGRPDATHAEVVETAQNACCDDFIQALPDGYNTLTCRACGFTGTAEKCGYIFEGNVGTCPSCKSTLTVSVSGVDGLVYDGTAKEPTVSVTLDGTELTSGSNYAVAHSNNVNAGTGTVAGASLDFSYTQNFTIAKASLTIKANDQAITYGGNIATGTNQVTSTGLASGDTLENVTLEASTSNVPGGTINPIAAVIKRGGEDVTANYNITYQPGTLTINKSRPTIAFASGYDPRKTYDGQIIANPTASDLTITGADYKDVTFTWSATPKDAGTDRNVTVTVTLTGTAKANNYTLSGTTFTAKGAIEKAESSITALPSASEITFGQTLSDSSLNGGQGSCPGTFAWEDSTFKPNAGTAPCGVIFTPNDSANYNAAKGTVSVAVAKARLDVTVPTASSIEYGQALSDSTLSGGTATNPNDNSAVSGTWTWRDPR